MITIGLTGSIAMGKTEVANIFRAEAIPVFDADKEVHALYDSKEGAALLGPLVAEAIVNDKVDRPTLSKLVLEQPALLEELEAIVHAQIARRRALFETQAEQAGHGILVVDVPLLFEKSGEKQVDVSIVVSAPEELQHLRALKRPGMTEEKLDMILKRQMPDAEKRRLANYVIINDGTLEDLRANTLAVLNNIRKEHRL
jgi:dephospho-CoA kinase